MSEKIKSLISKMSVKQKVGQLLLHGDDFVIKKCDVQYEQTRDGMISAHPDMGNVKTVNEIQCAAVEESELGIPVVFCTDVIHGYRTIFPIPLAEAMSFEPKLAEETAAAAAREAAACGVKWTFAPMVDIARNAHWGRVCEGSGEDTYIGSRFAEARVRGFQGSDASAPDKIAACPKHFAGYGFVEGGRDYNTVDISENKLHNVVLPPFRAAINAGALTVMAAFNDINGEPCTGSKWILNDILRKELGFGGMVVSDCMAIKELTVHATAENDDEACTQALEAGIDMDMASTLYRDRLCELVESGRIRMDTLDSAVERVLEFKEKLGLFDNPYVDENAAEKILLCDEHKAVAHNAAKRSVALLKKKVLPLDKKIRIALVGPMADDSGEMLGEWCSNGRAEECVTLYKALKEQANVVYAKGCDFDSDDMSGFDEAVEAAQNSDVVVAMIGQSRNICGESRSRSDLSVTGVQTELIRRLKATGRPIVIIVMSGRPLIIDEIYNMADDLLYTGALGTMAGAALADILFGRYNPSAKLVMSLPRTNGGAETVYYNHTRTGRPYADGNEWCSRYIDEPFGAFIPFGYGLSYTCFEYSELKVSCDNLCKNDVLKFSVTVKNTGGFDGEEIVQVYVSQRCGRNTRPVKSLKAFDKKMIKAGEEKIFNFELKISDLGYYDRSMVYKVDSGRYTLHVGTNSDDCICTEFNIIGGE